MTSLNPDVAEFGLVSSDHQIIGSNKTWTAPISPPPMLPSPGTIAHPRNHLQWRKAWDKS